MKPNWAKVGKRGSVSGVYYSFGPKRQGAWVYFLPCVPETAESVCRFIGNGGRTLRLKSGRILNLLHPDLRHKRVGVDKPQASSSEVCALCRGAGHFEDTPCPGC